MPRVSSRESIASFQSILNHFEAQWRASSGKKKKEKRAKVARSIIHNIRKHIQETNLPFSMSDDTLLKVSKFMIRVMIPTVLILPLFRKLQITTAITKRPWKTPRTMRASSTSDSDKIGMCAGLSGTCGRQILLPGLLS